MAEREDEWVEAGLLDPDAPNAEEQLALLAWLASRGCTTEELVRAAGRGRMYTAAADRVLMPTPTLTREDVAARCGMTPDDADRIWLAAGFPPAEPGRAAFTEDDVTLFGMVPAATALFGADTLLAFIRVVATSLARIAEAADAMFLTDVEGPRRSAGATEIEIAQAGAEGVAMLTALPELLAPLFRRHAAAAVERSRMVRAASAGDGEGFAGADRLRLAIGFADLVGWTALAERHDRRTLATAVGRFERAASERAVAAGARVVKSIGDAVMVVGHDPLAVVDVVAALRRVATDDEVLTGMRGAVVVGDVLARDGDYVGPTVNLAARATKEAPPGGIVVNAPVADALRAVGRDVVELEPRTLRGIDEPVVLALVGDR